MFERFIKQIEDKNLEIHGIKIIKEGKTIFEKYFDENIRYPIYSATKTITALGLGLLWQKEKVSEKDLISDFLPKEYLKIMPQKSYDIFKKLTIEDFLTMSINGFPFRPDGEDWLEFSLLVNKNFLKQNKISYSNISAYLVGVIAETIAKEPFEKYLNENLFSKLDIDYVKASTCPKGRFYGATGMQLTVGELAKIGELMRCNGKYNGKQIVPSKWIEKMTTKYTQSDNDGYGYFVWVYPNHYAISGKWGQKCLAYPQKKLTITYLSNLPDKSNEILKMAQDLANQV